MSEAVSESDKRVWGWSVRKAWQGMSSHFQQTAIFRFSSLGIVLKAVCLKYRHFPALISKAEKNDFHLERNETIVWIT